MMKKLLLVIALILPRILLAQGLPITTPPESPLQFNTERDGTVFYKFKGAITLRGILQARWGNDLANNTGKIIFIRFFPEKQEAQKLPIVGDGQDSHMISLNFEATLEQTKKLVQSNFNDIPNEFWRYNEGILERPVRLTLTHFMAAGECDHMYYYADFSDIQAIKAVSEVVPESVSAVDDLIFDDLLLVSTNDEYANLRQQPNTKSQVIEPLLKGTLLTKLKTVNNWYYVKVRDLDDDDNHEPTDVYGYIHKSQVIPVSDF